MATIQDALAIAWKLFQAGDLAGALRVYRKVVEIDPVRGRGVADDRGNPSTRGAARSTR